MQLIDAVMADVEQGFAKVGYVALPAEEEMVLDLRHFDEVALKPLELKCALELIPFYNLNEVYLALHPA